MTDRPIKDLIERTYRGWADAAEENPVLKARVKVLEEALTVNQRLLKTIYRLNTHGSVNEHDWENGGVGDLISEQIDKNRVALNSKAGS